MSNLSDNSATYAPQRSATEAEAVGGLLWPGQQPELVIHREFETVTSPAELHRSIACSLRTMHFSDYRLVKLDGVEGDALLSTFPDDLYWEYRKGGYAEKDFLIEYVSENHRPIFMSKIYTPFYDVPYDTSTFLANQRIYELYQKFGFADLYCIPMRSFLGGPGSYLAVSQRGVRATQFQVNIARQKPALRLLCEKIDFVCNRQLSGWWAGKSEAESVHVTKAQLRALSALANNDMTIGQMAKELHRSNITLSQHIAAARKALKVRTTQGAIKKAIMLGLIEYT